jgi:hypothetical protein
VDVHVHVGVVQLLSVIIILGLGLRVVVFVLCGKKGTTDVIAAGLGSRQLTPSLQREQVFNSLSTYRFRHQATSGGSKQLARELEGRCDGPTVKLQSRV